MKFSSIRALSLSAVLLSASFANAGIITQWGFNQGLTIITGTGTFNNANAGTGVGSTNGPSTGLAPSISFPAAAFGSSADTSVASGSNGYATQNSAQPADASGQGVQFHVSTIGKTDISYSVDFKPGSRASKYWQVVYTSNGTTWQNVPSSGSASISSLGVYSGTTISNSGLVTISAPSGLNATTLNSQSDWIQGLSYQFPTGGAWENNSNFGIGLYQIYNPNTTNASDLGYVSALSGLNSTDVTTGYIRSGAAGGTQRFDLITVSGIPEPTTLASLGVIGLTALSRRRKNAK